MRKSNLLNFNTRSETEFTTKALDLLGIDYSVAYDVHNGAILVHDELTFTADTEQTEILASLLNYNYERNILR